MKYLGDEVKTILALTPQVVSGAGSVTYGVAFDRLNYESAVFALTSGALAGSPTNAQLDVGIQECDTQNGAYAAVSGAVATVSGAAAVVPGQIAALKVDLKPRKRWIKATVTCTWTGGSGQTGVVGVVGILGEAKIVPAT